VPAVINNADPKGFTYLSDGSMCDNATLSVIDAIRTYAPSVDVMYLDPGRVDGSDLLTEPWILVEHCPDGFTRKIFGVWEMDMRVLDRLRAADSWNTNVLNDIDKINAAAKAEIQRKHREADAERADITAHVMASPKGQYSFKGEGEEVVTISDSTPVTRKEPGRSF